MIEEEEDKLKDAKHNLIALRDLYESASKKLKEQRQKKKKAGVDPDEDLFISQLTENTMVLFNAYCSLEYLIYK